MQPACEYAAADYGIKDADRLVLVKNNNQCARQNRERYIELQNWIKGRTQ